MTREQFLDNLIEFYSNNPRAVDLDSSNCRYRMDGLKCAIGRYIPDEFYTPSLEGPVRFLPKGILPEEIENLGRDFLADCQQLHDRSRYWQRGEYTLSQLSYEGLQTVDAIRIEYKA